jgi:hypothetical protein
MGDLVARLRRRTYDVVVPGPPAVTGGGRTAVVRAMGYKLLDAAQARWRKITGDELVALVRAGATFIYEKLQQRSDTTTTAAPDTDTEDGSVAT